MRLGCLQRYCCSLAVNLRPNLKKRTTTRVKHSSNAIFLPAWRKGALCKHKNTSMTVSCLLGQGEIGSWSQRLSKTSVFLRSSRIVSKMRSNGPTQRFVSRANLQQDG